MFDLSYTESVKKYLREIRKELRAKNYKQVKSRTRQKIGGMSLNYNYEYFIKGNLIFEFEIDNNYNTITTRVHYNNKGKKEQEEIMLGSVLELA